MGNGPGALHSPAAGNVALVCELAEPEPLRNQNNYRITEADRIGLGSLKQKCRGNLAAIELLKSLEADERTPTADEKRILIRCVGWGGLPQVFDGWNDQWEEQRQRLESLFRR